MVDNLLTQAVDQTWVLNENYPPRGSVGVLRKVASRSVALMQAERNSPAFENDNRSPLLRTVFAPLPEAAPLPPYVTPLPLDGAVLPPAGHDFSLLRCASAPPQPSVWPLSHQEPCGPQ